MLLFVTLGVTPGGMGWLFLHAGHGNVTPAFLWHSPGEPGQVEPARPSLFWVALKGLRQEA